MIEELCGRGDLFIYFRYIHRLFLNFVIFNELYKCLKSHNLSRIRRRDN